MNQAQLRKPSPAHDDVAMKLLNTAINVAHAIDSFSATRHLAASVETQAEIDVALHAMTVARDRLVAAADTLSPDTSGDRRRHPGNTWPDNT